LSWANKQEAQFNSTKVALRSIFDGKVNAGPCGCANSCCAALFALCSYLLSAPSPLCRCSDQETTLWLIGTSFSQKSNIFFNPDPWKRAECRCFVPPCQQVALSKYCGPQLKNYDARAINFYRLSSTASWINIDQIPLSTNLGQCKISSGAPRASLAIPELVVVIQGL
jgi:hypothetical protein